MQELPGHEKVETSQIFTHVMQKPKLGVRSPLEGEDGRREDAEDGKTRVGAGTRPKTRPPGNARSPAACFPSSRLVS